MEKVKEWIKTTFKEEVVTENISNAIWWHPVEKIGIDACWSNYGLRGTEHYLLISVVKNYFNLESEKQAVFKIHNYGFYRIVPEWEFIMKMPNQEALKYRDMENLDYEEWDYESEGE